ncbi:hypothetical protein D9M68_817870 [compost metagenome]
MENLMEAFTLDCPGSDQGANPRPTRLRFSMEEQRGNAGQSSSRDRDWNLRPSRDFQVQASAPNPDSSGDDCRTRSGSDGAGPGRSHPGSSP